MKLSKCELFLLKKDINYSYCFSKTDSRPILLKVERKFNVFYWDSPLEIKKHTYKKKNAFLVEVNKNNYFINNFEEKIKIFLGE